MIDHFMHFRVEIGEELPTEEDEDQYLFNNVDFSINTHIVSTIL